LFTRKVGSVTQALVYIFALQNREIVKYIVYNTPPICQSIKKQSDKESLTNFKPKNEKISSYYSVIWSHYSSFSRYFRNESIQNVPGKNKMDLYSDAKKWFTDHFNDSRDVIQNEDKDQGRIIGKGIIIVPWKSMLSSGIYYDRITIEIDVKDGRYRYRIYDMLLAIFKSQLYQTGQPQVRFTPEQLISKLADDGKSGFSKSQCRKLLMTIDVETKSAIASLTKTMNDNSNNF
jgi:hypothetical protein